MQVPKFQESREKRFTIDDEYDDEGYYHSVR